MVRTSAAVAGNDIDCRKEHFHETRSEVVNEVKKLIDKIGIVNVIALLRALNCAELNDIDSPCSKDFKAEGLFSLNACRGNALRIDDKLLWQKRWCNIGKIQFGGKSVGATLAKSNLA